VVCNVPALNAVSSNVEPSALAASMLQSSHWSKGPPLVTIVQVPVATSWRYTSVASPSVSSAVRAVRLAMRRAPGTATVSNRPNDEAPGISRVATRSYSQSCDWLLPTHDIEASSLDQCSRSPGRRFSAGPDATAPSGTTGGSGAGGAGGRLVARSGRTYVAAPDTTRPSTIA
jgi:hypothetical protein